MYRSRNDELIHPLDDPALVKEFLDQDRAWCDAGLNYTPIESMGRQHALNTARFILRKAQDICLSLAVAEGTSLKSYGDSALRTAVLDDGAARAWLLDTALVQALLVHAARTSSSRLPWEEIDTVPTSAATFATYARSAFARAGDGPRRDDLNSDFDDLPF